MLFVGEGKRMSVVIKWIMVRGVGRAGVSVSQEKG